MLPGVLGGDLVLDEEILNVQHHVLDNSEGHAVAGRNSDDVVIEVGENQVLHGSLDFTVAKLQECILLHSGGGPWVLIQFSFLEESVVDGESGLSSKLLVGEEGSVLDGQLLGHGVAHHGVIGERKVIVGAEEVTEGTDGSGFVDLSGLSVSGDSLEGSSLAVGVGGAGHWLSVDGLVEAPGLVVWHVDTSRQEELIVLELDVALVILLEDFDWGLGKGCGHEGKAQ